MSRRNKIIITTLIVTLTVLLVIVGILWFLNRSRGEEELTNTNQGIQLPGNLPTSSSATPPELQMPAEEQNLEAGVRAVASTFAERYGSYSNQSNFENLSSVRDLMTIAMKASTDSFVASQNGFNVSDLEDSPYYGVTTNALSVEIIDIDDDLGRAEVVVSTQRVETKISTNNPRSFYQDLNLILNKQDDGWKINSATWIDN